MRPTPPPYGLNVPRDTLRLLETDATRYVAGDSIRLVLRNTTAEPLTANISPANVMLEHRGRAGWTPVGPLLGPEMVLYPDIAYGVAPRTALEEIVWLPADLQPGTYRLNTLGLLGGLGGTNTAFRSSEFAVVAAQD